jgi:hypothetical protein
MHWYWEVEVNGQSVDASRPVVVTGGDHVEIDLWADFDPYGAGFAAAHFAVRTGDEFFALGPVNTDPSDGYGLNGNLDGLGEQGMLVDSNGDGAIDAIDGILPFQLPHAFNSEYDFSDPIRIYGLGWTPSDAPTSRIVLLHGPTLGGESLNRVYLDAFGRFSDYGSVADMLVFIPCPSGAVVILAGAVIAIRRNRRRSYHGVARCSS